jgi:ubiquinone/menaquinone biosynthesis C-methylase UbiE
MDGACALHAPGGRREDRRMSALLDRINHRAVGVAQRRFPDADIRQMDARKLDFPDAALGLVTFTYNGIDSVDLADRELILQEVYRVLAPGGAFVFCSLNREGPAHDESWWAGDAHWTGVVGLLRRIRRALLAAWHTFANRAVIRPGGAIALAPLSVHNFGVVAMFTSLRAQAHQLEAAGFALEKTYSNLGTSVDVKAGHSAAPWHYFVARKPTSEAAPVLTRTARAAVQ